MGLFTKILFGPILSPIADKVFEDITGSDNSDSDADSITGASYGDVIGVRRTGYKHFGVYINNNSIIQYAARNGDFIGGEICIHETTLQGFLDGSLEYFVCKFPKEYGKPSEVNISSSFMGNTYKTNWLDIIKFFKSFNYTLYSPEETVRRARSKLGENKYNLATNNCEHFAIWCKTGISESHQVNELLNKLPLESLTY